MGTNLNQALYPGIMGAGWNNLDQRLQRFHSAEIPRCARGKFQIRHGTGEWARFLARLLRLPREGNDVPAMLWVRGGGVPPSGPFATEIWERSFAGQKFVSYQYASRSGLLAERFALFELLFRLEAAGQSLVFVPAGVALALGPIRMRLPARLSPQVSACVSSSNDYSERLIVFVSVKFPMVGMVLAYEGFIDPEVGTS